MLAYLRLSPPTTTIACYRLRLPSEPHLMRLYVKYYFAQKNDHANFKKLMIPNGFSLIKVIQQLEKLHTDLCYTQAVKFAQSAMLAMRNIPT